MLSKSGKSEYFCLVPDLRGNVFSYFSIENDVYCGFAVCGLCYVEATELHAPGVLLTLASWARLLQWS